MVMRAKRPGPAVSWVGGVVKHDDRSRSEMMVGKVNFRMVANS